MILRTHLRSSGHVQVIWIDDKGKVTTEMRPVKLTEGKRAQLIAQEERQEAVNRRLARNSEQEKILIRGGFHGTQGI
jgi:uncharacterized iron-regulated protein